MFPKQIKTLNKIADMKIMTFTRHSSCKRFHAAHSDKIIAQVKLVQSEGAVLRAHAN